MSINFSHRTVTSEEISNLSYASTSNVMNAFTIQFKYIVESEWTREGERKRIIWISADGLFFFHISSSSSAGGWFNIIQRELISITVGFLYLKLVSIKVFLYNLINIIDGCEWLTLTFLLFLSFITYSLNEISNFRSNHMAGVCRCCNNFCKEFKAYVSILTCFFL